MDQNQTQAQKRPNNFIFIPCTKGSFFRVWMEFLTPYHKLAMREKDVAAKILSQYFKLKEQCSDPIILKELLWSQSSRLDMRTSLNMSQPHFQMVLGKLREQGVIKDGDINPRYIPHIRPESNTFELRILFDYSSDSNREVVTCEAVKER